MTNRIPHIYHNTVYAKKLFEIIKKKYLILDNIYKQLNNFNDLNACSGALLDILGGNFKIERKGRSDEEYRKVIAFEINSLTFMGTPEEIKKVISTYFEENVDQINIKEQSGKIIIQIPDTIETQEIKRLLLRLKSAGVGYLVDYEIYIEDYLISELEEKTIEEIANIKLARG